MDRNGDSTLCCSIHFCQDDSGDICHICKLSCLRKRILSGPWNVNSEYAQNSLREHSVEQRKSTEELKRLNQPNSAPPAAPQPIQPIVIQCDLPQTINKLAKQADGINWELEEIRNILPELKTRIDLTPVQKSLAEMQKSLTEMSKLLERVGNLSEKYSCKWIRWLPDFSLLVALKWIALLLVIGAAALAGWYGVAAIRGLFL